MSSPTPHLSDSVHLVLLRPEEPLNLGAIARVMKNCGLTRWSWVEPATDDLVTARRVAVHAEDLLVRAPVAASLDAALADATWVVGTTSRRIPGREYLAPREVAEEAARRARGGTVALVLGGEGSGLSNEDLVRCHALSCIPGTRAQPSYNLAQAALVYLYELELAFGGALEIAPAPERAAEADFAPIEHALRSVLARSGFADLDRPRHGVLDLMLPLRRAGLTPEEARLWHAALRVVERGLKAKDEPGA